MRRRVGFLRRVRDQDADWRHREISAKGEGLASRTERNVSYEADSQRLVNRRVGLSIEATYTFDGLGQRSAQGPTSNKTAEVFGYTGTGRLASYAASTGASAAYSFDASGQRTRSEVRSAGATTTTDWTYAGLQLLALSASRSDGTTWAITYLYDAGGKPYACR